MVKSLQQARRRFLRKPLLHREAQIIKRMKTVVGLPAATIAEVVQRDRKSVYNALKDKLAFAKRGRPEKLTAKEVNHLVKILRSMVQRAKARFEVTHAMVKKTAKCDADDKVIRKGLQSKGIRFRRLRSKPLLTKEDIRKRLAFATLYRKWTPSMWRKRIQLHIDLKNFAVYTTQKTRDFAAMREVRGAYRSEGEGLDAAYVVLPKDLRFNGGGKPCRIAAGVGGGKVRLWSEVEGKWTGASAATLYKGAVLTALKRGWPKNRTWTLLEDNDPTGFKSKLGLKAKAESKIKVFKIPERSPDLSVCDYAVWAEINRKMRAQEKDFPKSKYETRAEYVARLHNTAKSLTPNFINKSIGDMTRRCQRLYDARGGYFQEGGR